jgi:hypothetical protein
MKTNKKGLGMFKNAVIIASLLPSLAFADTVINDYRTHTVITPSANYVISTTPSTTYVIGPAAGTAPIAVMPTAKTHTYITPSGTYMSIPNGKTTTILQVSGAKK